jgi:malonyl CoA-acyl carrier protein transacylase
MSPSLNAVKEAFKAAQPKPWKISMVSSVHKKVITTQEELVKDIEDNMVSSVYWWQTYKWMSEKLAVQKFINIGPIDTLIRLAERIPLHGPTIVEDLSKNINNTKTFKEIDIQEASS